MLAPRVGQIWVSLLILARVLGFPQSREIDQRPGKKFRQGGSRISWSLSEAGRASFLPGVRVGVGPGAVWSGGLGGLPTPLLAVCAGGTLLFLPAL